MIVGILFQLFFVMSQEQRCEIILRMNQENTHTLFFKGMNNDVEMA